jgi:phosphatidylinositol-3-phosphatase
MWRWVLPGAVVVAVLIGFVASRNGPTQHAAAHAPPIVTQPPTTKTTPVAAPTCGTKHGQQAKIRHVIWIWMGTQGYRHVVGKLRVVPYVNQLAQSCGLATRYATITHPAIANDVGVLAGDPHGLVHNSCDTACTTTAPTLLSQVRSWRAFIGGMHGACAKLEGIKAHYSRLANPPTYVTPPGCHKFDLPLGSPASGPLQRMLVHGALPAFTLIAPDGCHNSGFDKHCKGKRKRSTFLARADLWLHDWITALTASPAYKSGSTVIFITWNQGAPAKPLRIDCTARPAGGSCQVPLIVVSPYVKPGTATPARLSHYSLLGATEHLLGVPRLGHAAGPSGQALLRAFDL